MTRAQDEAAALVSDHREVIRAMFASLAMTDRACGLPLRTRVTRHTSPLGGFAIHEHTHGAIILGSQLPTDLYARALDACANARAVSTLNSVRTVAIVPLQDLRALARAVGKVAAWQTSKRTRHGHIRVFSLAAWGESIGFHTRSVWWAPRAEPRRIPPPMPVYKPLARSRAARVARAGHRR